MTRRRKVNSNSANQDLHIDGQLPLLTHLKSVLASLKPTERLIADYVLADPENVVAAAIAEISQECGASVGSIVGFCRRLGLKGFADFKISLARSLAQAGLPTGRARRNGSLVEQIFHFHAESLVETLRINQQSNFDRAAHLLGKASRVEMFSIGLSFPVAYTASCKLQLIGIPTTAHIDSHMQLISATQIRAGEIAFGVSCSGATRETVHCLEVARTKGATTMCLTNAVGSPITAVSDLCLYATPSEIKYFQAPLASRVTQLAVIDALFVSLALRRKDKMAARLQESGKELLKRRWD